VIGPYEPRRCPDCGLRQWDAVDLLPGHMVCTCDADGWCEGTDGICDDPQCCGQPGDDAGHGDTPLRPVRTTVAFQKAGLL
jgi:hypothetical protein